MKKYTYKSFSTVLIGCALLLSPLSCSHSEDENTVGNSLDSNLPQSPTGQSQDLEAQLAEVSQEPEQQLAANDDEIGTLEQPEATEVASEDELMNETQAEPLALEESSSVDASVDSIDEVISTFESEKEVAKVDAGEISQPTGEESIASLPAETEERSTSLSDAPIDYDPGSMGRYTIVEGDNLGFISSKLFGTAKKWRFLAEYNKLADADTIETGDVLLYPLEMASTGETHSESEKVVAVDTASGTVTVERNDTLSQIAERVLGKSHLWKKIWDMNRDKIEDPNKIEIGQELRLEGVSAH